MKLIESKTLATAAASIEFTSIPDSFTDLYLTVNLRSTAATTVVDGYLQFNGDTTAANYSWRSLFGLGSGSPGSGNNSANFNQLGQVTAANLTANTFGNTSVYIPNYRSAVAKSHSIDYSNENNATATWMGMVAALYTGTSPITSIAIKPSSGNWAIGSTVSLYGILKGSDGIVTTS